MQKCIYAFFSLLLVQSFILITPELVNAAATPYPSNCSSPSISAPPFATNWLPTAVQYIKRAEVAQAPTSNLNFTTQGANYKVIFFKNNESFNTDYRAVFADQLTTVTVKGTGTDTTITLQPSANAQYRSVPYGTDSTNFSKMTGSYGVGGISSGSPKIFTNVECIEFASTNVVVDATYPLAVNKVLPYSTEQTLMPGNSFDKCIKYCSSTLFPLTNSELRAASVPVSGSTGGGTSTAQTDGLTAEQLHDMGIRWSAWALTALLGWSFIKVWRYPR